MNLPPAEHGHHKFPDGTQIWRSYIRRGLWMANFRDKSLVLDANGVPAYFTSAEHAVAALVRAGQGPPEPAASEWLVAAEAQPPILTVTLTGPGLVVNHPAAVVYDALTRAGYAVATPSFTGQYQSMPAQGWPDNELAKNADSERHPRMLVSLTVVPLPWGG